MYGFEPLWRVSDIADHEGRFTALSRCKVALKDLMDTLSGHADPQTSDRVRTHLAAGCVRCEAEAHWMTRVLSALREQPGPVPPDEALALAKARFRERYARPQRPTIFARLRFDGRTQTTLAFARGSRGRTVQMVYDTEGHDIELWQEEQEDGSWYLIGQVLPRQDHDAIQPELATLTASDGRTVRALAQTDSMNEFHFDEIPSGVYEILVRLTDQDVRLTDVVIGE